MRTPLFSADFVRSCFCQTQIYQILHGNTGRRAIHLAIVAVVIAVIQPVFSSSPARRHLMGASRSAAPACCRGGWLLERLRVNSRQEAQESRESTRTCVVPRRESARYVSNFVAPNYRISYLDKKACAYTAV